MIQSRYWLPVLLVLSAVVVSGCLPDEMPTQVVPTPTFTPDVQPVDSDGGEGDAPEAVPATPETIPEATPYDLTQLHATDPTTVTIASGRPVLLEFFAFW